MLRRKLYRRLSLPIMDSIVVYWMKCVCRVRRTHKALISNELQRRATQHRSRNHTLWLHSTFSRLVLLCARMQRATTKKRNTIKCGTTTQLTTIYCHNICYRLFTGSVCLFRNALDVSMFHIDHFCHRAAVAVFVFRFLRCFVLLVRCTQQRQIQKGYKSIWRTNFARRLYLWPCLGLIIPKIDSLETSTMRKTSLISNQQFSERFCQNACAYAHFLYSYVCRPKPPIYILYEPHSIRI